MARSKASEDCETTALTKGSGNSNSISVTKYCIYAFFPICFIVMIVLAAFFKSYIEEWSSLTHANLSVVTSLLISAGFFGLLFSLGCWAKDKEKLCFVFTYTLVIILQIIAIVYGCIQVADKDHALKKTIEVDMKIHFFNYSQNIKNTFDELQIEKSCCGVFSAKDYAESNRTIPFSCCEISENMGKYCKNESLAYKDGCASKMYDDIIYSVRILSNTTICLTVLQIIFGLCGLAFIIKAIKL